MERSRTTTTLVVKPKEQSKVVDSVSFLQKNKSKIKPGVVQQSVAASTNALSNLSSLTSTTKCVSQYDSSSSAHTNFNLGQVTPNQIRLHQMKETIINAFDKKQGEDSIKNNKKILIGGDGPIKANIKSENRDGKGKYQYPNGDVYYGQIKNDKFEGEVQFFFASGDRYEGSVQDGQKNGKGVYFYNDGTVYNGYWFKDKKNGYGLLVNEQSNEQYEGNWKDNNLNGLGVFQYNYNIRYEGEFLDGKKHGLGDIFFEDSNERYSGQWTDDKAHGQGTFTYSNGDIYSGEFYQGMKNGKGIYKYAEGQSAILFEGIFKEDEMLEGELTFSNGDRYIGKFECFKKQGFGKYQYNNGDEYEGEWKNDKRHGRGVLKINSGKIIEGEWVEGECDMSQSAQAPSSNNYRQLSGSTTNPKINKIRLINTNSSTQQGLFTAI